MGIFNLGNLGKLGIDAARAIRNHKYELSPHGIYVPGARAFIGGAFRTAICPAGGAFGPWQIDQNRVVKEGLIDILKVYFTGGAQQTAFYLAPYSGNVTPQDSWTAANFAANATEFEGYTSATRVQWTPTAPTTVASVGNSANIAASTLILNAAANLYGIAMIGGANTKSATTGKLVAASPFETPRTNMAIGDKLAVEYVISAADENDA